MVIKTFSVPLSKMVSSIPYYNQGHKVASYDQIAQEILNNTTLLGHLESIRLVQETAEEKAREEAEAKAKEKEKEEEEDKKKKCLPVTEPNIRMVLEPTMELTTQESVSLFDLQTYVRRIENGEHASRMPDIKVAENIIIEGHHRFIAAKLCGQEAPRITWEKYPYDKSNVYPVKNIIIGNY